MSAGLVLSDRYRLLEQLAIGGMGEVWRAMDEMLSRPVAVKLLRQEHVRDEAARIRFRSEARFAAALQHGGIAQVYDYGEQDGTAYLVMELVSGHSLSRELAQAGRIDPERVVDLVEQAARALQVAHSAGIIHRDIKPANLMITTAGTLKITDFGIARGAQGSDLTQTGMVMGTVHYLSPEQASGRAVTGASDLYSLGVVAYECLAGKPPFDADTPVAVALKHVSDPPPRLPADVPEPVCGLVEALLEKNPAGRFGDARAVADRAYLILDALRGGGLNGGLNGAGLDELGFGDPRLGDTGFNDPWFDRTSFRDSGFRDTGSEDTGRTGAWAAGSTRGAAPYTLPSEELAARATGAARRTPLFVAAMTAGLLILGFIVVGSLLRDSAPADHANNNGGSAPAEHGRGEPAATASPSLDPLTPSPNSAIRDPAGNRRTSTDDRTPPPRKARSTPNPTRTDVPEPTPTPVEPTTPPSSPSPDPSSSAAGGLGSGT